MKRQLNRKPCPARIRERRGLSTLPRPCKSSTLSIISGPSIAGVYKLSVFPRTPFLPPPQSFCSSEPLPPSRDFLLFKPGKHPHGTPVITLNPAFSCLMLRSSTGPYRLETARPELRRFATRDWENGPKCRSPPCKCFICPLMPLTARYRNRLYHVRESTFCPVARPQSSSVTLPKSV